MLIMLRRLSAAMSRWEILIGRTSTVFLCLTPTDRLWILWIERMIVCGSMFGGIMFQDLSDIDRDVIRFAADNDLSVISGFRSGDADADPGVH